MAKIAALAAIGAFWPQIRKLLRRIGYRDWREKKDEKPPTEPRP